MIRQSTYRPSPQAISHARRLLDVYPSASTEQREPLRQEIYRLLTHGSPAADNTQRTKRRHHNRAHPFRRTIMDVLLKEAPAPQDPWGMNRLRGGIGNDWLLEHQHVEDFPLDRLSSKPEIDFTPLQSPASRVLESLGIE